MAGRAPDAGAAEAAVKGSSAAMAEVRARESADEDPDVSNPDDSNPRLRRDAAPEAGENLASVFRFFPARPKTLASCGTPLFFLVANSFRGAARDGAARRARTADLSEPHP